MINSRKEQIKREMLTQLCNTDVHFKSQQRGDPELTHAEKYCIASEVLHRNPANFLFRFGKHIKSEQLQYFEEINGDYEVEFHLKELRKTLDTSLSRKLVQNRRYAAMQKLIQSGEYFAETEMRRRNPMLYEQMVGRFLTDEEKQKVDSFDMADCRFSTILLDHLVKCQEKDLKIAQEEDEDGMVEEQDEDEEAEDGMEGESEVEAEDKSVLKQEFTNIMYESFLSGTDKDFDYRSVDSCSEYDPMSIISQDKEDAYFDDEDEHDYTMAPHRLSLSGLSCSQVMEPLASPEGSTCTQVMERLATPGETALKQSGGGMEQKESDKHDEVSCEMDTSQEQTCDAIGVKDIFCECMVNKEAM